MLILEENISFLGYEIENLHVWPGHEKVKDVLNFLTPKNIRLFLGCQDISENLSESIY